MTYLLSGLQIKILSKAKIVTLSQKYDGDSDYVDNHFVVEVNDPVVNSDLSSKIRFASENR